MSRRALLTDEQLETGLQALNPAWSAASRKLVRTVGFESFPVAVQFVVELAPIAEQLDHHPDLSLSWRTVAITLTTHSAGGLTALDLELAAALDSIIDRLAG